jgi:ABC-type transport system substrate-binding protein
VRSYYLYVFENRLAGLAPVLAQARKAGRLDYDAPIEGLRTLDRYTLQIRFAEPNYAFQHWLTTTAFAAVAKEIVAAKGDAAGRVMEDPVGTGPYRLAEWRRSQRIVLEANPSYRDARFPAPPPGSTADAEVAKGLTGRKLPLSPRVEIAIVEEAQPRLLAFRRGELDYVDVPSSLADTVLDGATLKPDLAKAGVRLHRQVDPSLAFTFFNMEDPVVGGYTPEKIALRRAITMANDRQTFVRVLANGQAELATQMIPPPVPGHSPALAIKDPFDPAAARALLDRFGYRDRDGDGFRELPDGKPLVLRKGMTPVAADRAASELWTRNLAAIGLRTEFVVQKWPELNKMAEAGQLQIWNLAWISGTPDVDTFYSPLYSHNVGTSNDARLKLAEYDQAYERMRALPEGPERQATYRRMNELVVAYAPWILETYSYQNRLAQPWLRGLRLHPFLQAPWMYYEASR